MVFVKANQKLAVRHFTHLPYDGVQLLFPLAASPRFEEDLCSSAGGIVAVWS